MPYARVMEGRSVLRKGERKAVACRRVERTVMMGQLSSVLD